MIGDTEYGRLRQRAKSPAAMSAENPVLASGEFAATINGTEFVVKMGNGTTPWNDLPALNDGGGGGGVKPYPLRKTVFETFTVPRNAGTGQVNTSAITWNVSYVYTDDDTGALVETTTKPDWGGRAVGDLFLTDETEGQGWYRFAVNFSFGLPAADAFTGASIRIGRDDFDPVFRHFHTTPKLTGFRGVQGGWVTPMVPVDADDGARLQFVVHGDPLTGAGTGFAPGGESVAMLRVEMERLSGTDYRNYL